jgi:hypothetical protein
MPEESKEKKADEKKTEDSKSTAVQLAEIAVKVLGGGGFAFLVSSAATQDLFIKIAASTVGGAVATFAKPIKKEVDEELEEAGQSVVDVARKQKAKVMPTVTGFEQKYLEALKTYCYDLTIEGFKGELPTLALNDVFVPLQLNADAKGWVNATGVKRIWDLLPKEQAQKTDEDYRRLIIIGDPGHGKTTLMKYLTLSFTTERYKQEQAKRLLPVLLLFRSLYSDIQNEITPNLPDLIVKSIKSLPRCAELQPTQAWVQDKLRKREVLVMLDGLDEVPEARRELVSRWANRQMQEYDTYFILTSRPHGYESPDLFTGLQAVKVLDFNLDQKREFLEKWYAVVMWRQKWETIYHDSQRKAESEQLTEESARAQSETEAKQAAADLMRQITGNFALNRLSSNPLLVTIIAATHRAFETLPDRRVKLYQKVLNLLLEDRPNRRDTHLTLRNAADNQVILQELALALSNGGKTQFTKREGSALIKAQLAAAVAAGKAGETEFTPEKFLREMQTIAGLLVGGESDLYQFSHKTFQEYLTALELDGQGKGDVLVAKLQQGSEGLKGWEEVVSFYCAIANADAMVEATLALRSDQSEIQITALELMRRVVIEEKSPLATPLQQQLNMMLSKYAEVLDSIAILEERFRDMKMLRERKNKNFVSVPVMGSMRITQEVSSGSEIIEEITSEPIPPEAITWMKQQQANGKFQYVGTDDWKAFCLWLTTLSGLRVDGKLFVYRLPTEAELQQVGLNGQSGQFIVRVLIHNRYEALMSYLVNQQWKEANRETDRVILEVAGQTERGFLMQDDLKNFPCDDLLAIDKLWVEASNGHFGFSVQKNIWQECGSPMRLGKDWDRFCDRVGWKVKGEYVDYGDLKKNSSLSPAGELPFQRNGVPSGVSGGVVVVGRTGWGHLFSRSDL